MKKLLNNLLFGKYSPVIFFAVSAVGVLFNYGYRFGYVFVDNSTFKYFSFSMLIAAVVLTVFLLAASSLKMKNSDICNKKPFMAVQGIAEIFSIIYIIVDAVNYITGGKESAPVGLRLVAEILPFWAGIVCIAFLLFIFPNFKKGVVKKAVAGVISLALIVSVYSALFPVAPFKFTALPSVFDNGTDYAVVFSTSDNSAGYIEYDYNGEHIKKFDSDNGRKRGSSTIHAIHVPYEQLSGNSYKVGATRVIDELSYGGRSGKTIESDYIDFNDNFGDEIDVLTVSDWHTYNEKAKEAVSYLGDYNAVILLGDAAPGMMFEAEAEDYILAFASDLTSGAMPVIFARGNHETRGRQADDLSAYLGMKDFYYTASLGDYNIIVLDSGEDKKDDHPEYGGMVTYEQNRKDMVNWLNTLENSDGKKTIALSHSDEICIEEDMSQTAHNKLDELGVSILLSGHLHEFDFKNEHAYPTLIDGGINANGKGAFVASKVVLTPDNIAVTSVDNHGKTVIDETVLWR